jgi:hypothetical protein
MYVPTQTSDKYYSIKYSNLYIIFTNTANLDHDQISWIKSELAFAQRFPWIVVVGLLALSKVESDVNFIDLLLNHHVAMYLSYGEYYESTVIEYSLAGHNHKHFQDFHELVLIEQGPSWLGDEDKPQSNSYINKTRSYYHTKISLNTTLSWINETILSTSSDTYATRQPGYGIMNPKYNNLIWQEYSSNSHRVINQYSQTRLDFISRKEEEIKNVEIIFILTFLIFTAAFLQVFIQKKLEKKRLSSFQALENVVIE